MVTPIVRCPVCEHPIDNHSATAPCNAEAFGGCHCQTSPNTIAVALLFGDLTPTPETVSIRRRPDGSWS